jgi:enoyl-[acyl-carrier protein] reductase I
LAHAPNLKTTPLLQTSLEAYTEAHEISAYSLISIAQATQPLLDTSSSSITTLSYLGAVRAIPGYHVMGPAKASLEAIVRGLAVELAPTNTRVNAVSAGPIATLAAKGGIANFERMQEEMRLRAPLGTVTAEQVASTVTFLATQGTGITGQTIYVDGGYSIVGGPPPAAYSKD